MPSSPEAICDIDPNWSALYRDFQANATHWSPPHGLVRLVRWPDLIEVPDELILSVARISALLWKKPTASHLISRILGGERDETFRALQMLAALRYIEFLPVAGAPASNSSPAAAMAQDPGPQTENKPSGLSTFIGKLRQRLLG